MFETATAPAGTPISVQDAKTHLALTISEFDGFIDTLIRVAAGMAETYLNGCVLDTVRRFYCDRFTGSIRIPHGLVRSVASVEYKPAGGEWTTLDASIWQYAIVGGQCVVFAAPGKSFPSVSLSPHGGVRITFTSGFGANQDDVPEPVKHALRLTVGNLFENRESGEQAMSSAAQNLLAPYRTLTQEMF